MSEASYHKWLDGPIIDPTKFGFPPDTTAIRHADWGAPPIGGGPVAIIGRSFVEAMVLEGELPDKGDPRFVPVIVGIHERTGCAKFVKAYAPLDLAPEVRSDREEEWFKRKLEPRLKPGVEVIYVDLD